MNSRKWTAQESEQLVALVGNFQQEQRPVDWNMVAAALQPFSSLQCKAHYAAVLNQPKGENERYHEWTDLEKELLLEAVSEIGRDWEKVQMLYFPWSTPMKLKNKHYALVMLEKTEKHGSIGKSTPVHDPVTGVEKELYRFLRDLLGM